MLPREVLIFKNWLKAFEGNYDSFDYNVRIGAGRDPGPNWPPSVREQAIKASQLRIDAVAWNGAAPTLIEVKDRAGASAVGQLITYQAVWDTDHPGLPSPPLILVTNRIQDSILPIVQKAGIRLDQIPTDFSSLAVSRKVFVPGY